MSRVIRYPALLTALFAVGAAFSPATDQPAADYYLKIKGIEGEAADGSIALAGFAWDTRADVGRFAEYTSPRDVASGMASGREASTGMATGRRTHKPLTIVKQVDKATPKLMEACANGTHVGDVEVWSREGNQAYLRYTLKDAIITSYSITRAPDSSARPVESVSFSYQKVEVAPAEAANERTNLNSSKSNRL